MRDQKWLEGQLNFLIAKYFSDVPLSNPLAIRFGREAKFRFGSIRLVSDRRAKRAPGAKGLREILKLKGEPKKSVITITSMFAKESVPVDVVRYTIAHELCHYAHGFSSANKRLFRYPHHGGVVNRELRGKGARHLILAFKMWLRQYRKKILAGRAAIWVE